MKKRYLIGGGILLAAIIYLLYLSLGDSVSYYVTVSEFYERESELHDKNIRVAGAVLNPIEWDTEKLELKFNITEGGKNMPVIFNGAQPTGFKVDSNILVEGKYDVIGIFQATKLILKCPSKYEPIE